MRYSRRMDGLPPYLFAEIERKIAEKRKQGVDVISLGIGDPDTPTPPHIVEEMQRQVADAANHQYPTNRGTDEFRQAVADFYRRRFDVELDPETEVFPLLGAKEAIAHICLNFLDAGDICLSADPGYPVYTSGPILAGGEPYPMPLVPELGFKPDLDAIDDVTLQRARMLFCNYPNNPTGAVLEEGDDFFERLVDFGRKHDIAVIHDNAYSEITFDGYVAPSFLQTPGAKEAGVEFYSLSKTYNMTGWRIGAVVGNADIIAKYWTLKSNIDSGMFAALQRTAAFALSESQQCVSDMCDIYQRRRDLVIGALGEQGIEVQPPKATIYIWVRVPEGYTSSSFADMVLDKCGVVVPPGSGYGPSGEGFVRISLTAPDERIAEALDRIKQNL
ncbi:MAG TPA: aminotransferase class I/II-fold pyridoxal phosphate-dependent enzyme [Actinobacteria bacterium]|nr:aminotransferase class I/II-fold pyridoxal phosphate-dependent enzyme [Actinomycetota bacterium]